MTITTRNEKGSPLTWNEMDENFEELKKLQLHNHDNKYAVLSHNHDDKYALLSHSHQEFTEISDLSVILLSECFNKLTLDINGA